MARIGLFFGSFNPIHNGHVKMAYMALSNGLDEVWLIVSKQNPFKAPYEVSDTSRCIMVSLACRLGMVPYFKEITKDLSGRTFDTLEYIKHHELRKGDNVIIICGDDVYYNIHTWYKGDEILKNYSFLIFSRIYHNHLELQAELSKKVQFEVGPQYHAYLNDSTSSTKIRDGIKNNIEEVQFDVPDLVYKYIKENKLYVNNIKT